jgi:chromate reductase, NAD(P)H dehydrogenase (quinone)
MRILGISGSARRGSHNTKLLRAAAESLPSGAALVEWDGLAGLPIYDEDLEADRPQAVAELVAAIDAADAVLIATPEYNSSIPGGLKNALDWASRPLRTNPLRNKPALVIGASTGLFGAVWAQAEARKVLQSTGARVLDAELAVGMADSAFDDDGCLADPELAERLETVLAELGAQVEARRELAAA